MWERFCVNYLDFLGKSDIFAPNISNEVEMANSIEDHKGEIVMYQPDETIRLEVRLEDATSILKEFLLRGYAINQQLMRMEQRMDAKLDAQQNQLQKIESALADHQEKIDFFVRTNQSPMINVSSPLS